MRLQTQAEIFIQTLEDMLQHDRAREKRRLRRQVQTHVDRFMMESRANPDVSDVSTYGTDSELFVTEDFWIIAATKERR